MVRRPRKLTLNNGYPKAQIAEDSHARAHGGSQQADWEQPNYNEQAKQASECHLTGARYGDLQMCTGLVSSGRALRATTSAVVGRQTSLYDG